MTMQKTGIIGAGNIGFAIAKGLVKKGKSDPATIYLSRRRLELLETQKQSGFTIADNRTLATDCQVVILAVLPGQAEEVVAGIREELQGKGKILASVAAAVSLKELKQWCGPQVNVVRMMPNIATEYGAGMTCISGEDEESIRIIQSLMEPLGETLIMKEQLMPAATILAACGIAFFLRYIRAVSQGGIQIGFHADEAGKIAAQTARGAAEILLQTGHHPETEIDRVTTPMGCTISGLNEMEHFGLSSAMIKGIIKSYEGISELK